VAWETRPVTSANAPLRGLRVIESSLLGPGLVATFLSDLGADVVKVEPPSGDYIRQMTWPIIDGVSLLHLHTHRGKRSIAIDLKTSEGVDVYRDLVRGADVVVEAMRPGSLARLGIGYDDLKVVNPALVFCTISGYGATGPYRDMPSHGIAYDTWAGLIEPAVDDQGFSRLPVIPNIGINVGPMIGALGILASVIRARETGGGCRIEVAQADARLPGLVQDRDTPGLPPTGRRGHGQPVRRLRAACPRPGRHVGGGPIPDLPDLRRPHPVHGIGTGLLEELL